MVKGITFDEKKNRSLLHMQAAAPATPTRNRILTYVYNLFGEREIAGPGKKSEPPRERSSEGITLKAGPATPAGGASSSDSGSAASPGSEPHRPDP